MSKEKKICYISGAITGIEEHVYKDEFNRGKLLAERRGMIGLSPIDLPHKHGGTWEEYMREDVWALTQCHSILMMASWEGSRGAKLEMHIAQELGLEVIYESDFDAPIFELRNPRMEGGEKTLSENHFQTPEKPAQHAQHAQQVNDKEVKF